jgi:hypothetical protein
MTIFKPQIASMFVGIISGIIGLTIAFRASQRLLALKKKGAR